MKQKKLFVTLPVMAMALTSCGGQVIDYNTHLTDYIFEMQYHDNFNILQLTDLHWNVNSSTTSSKQYLDKLIKEVDRKIKKDQGNDAKIDLVELTGDQFMLANTYHVKTFIEYMEAQATLYGFKYAIIWGNHDRHGMYSPNWLADQYRNAEHCFYKEFDDNLYGRSNFVINLNQGNDTVWQIANLDSGASFSESPLSIGRNYDYIRDDQVDWWKKIHKEAEDRSFHAVPTIAYYHIPQQDNGEAWELVKSGEPMKNRFFKLEGFGDAGKDNYQSLFIKEGKLHSLKAAFMGHAHNVDWTVEYDGVVIGLGVKTGTELYYAHINPESANEDVQRGLASLVEPITEKFDLVGASLVTITDNHNFDLEHVYYNERIGQDDFVMWERW